MITCPIKKRNMPEAPDLQVFAKNLNKLFAGRKLEEIKIVNAKSLKEITSFTLKIF